MSEIVVEKAIEVSVIIPVYQAEDYIEKCLYSILKQSYQEIEILLIDDGSTDNSPKICDEFSNKYSFVKTIHQKNQGCGITRNIGMNNTKGKYLVFVDADDYLDDKDYLRIMVEQIQEQQADIVVGNYSRYYNGRVIRAKEHGYHNGMDSRTIDFQFQGFFSGGVLAYAWCKMYRRKFIENHNLQFTDLEYSEDKLFNMECYACKPIYAFVDACVYCYRDNPASLSHIYKSNFFEIWIRLATKYKEYLMERGEEQGKGMVAFTILFAVFFHSKQEYEYAGRKMSVVRKVIMRYAKQRLAAQAFSELAQGKYLQEVSSIKWKFMMRVFCIAIKMHLYSIIALGIKLLIELKIEDCLSSIGKERKFLK